MTKAKNFREARQSQLLKKVREYGMLSAFGVTIDGNGNVEHMHEDDRNNRLSYLVEEIKGLAIDLVIEDTLVGQQVK